MREESTAKEGDGERHSEDLREPALYNFLVADGHDSNVILEDPDDGVTPAGHLKMKMVINALRAKSLNLDGLNRQLVDAGFDPIDRTSSKFTGAEHLPQRLRYVLKTGSSVRLRYQGSCRPAKLRLYTNTEDHRQTGAPEELAERND